jgi:hypothetical protein
LGKEKKEKCVKIHWQRLRKNRFVETLKKKKRELHRLYEESREDDLKTAETLLYRIELLNILIAEFQGFYHINSIRNLKHRAKF